MVATVLAPPWAPSRDERVAQIKAIRCPVLLVHGSDDLIVPASVTTTQGGLTTAMELVAARRPFLYFPLANHFEQQRHASHRPDQYRAGRLLDYRQTDPDLLAAAIVDEMASPADCLPAVRGAAARAAAMIAELI